MFNCQQCRIEIETATRAETVSAQAAEHLAACPACYMFQTERQRLRQLVSELEPVAAPPDFEFRLRARMAAHDSAPAARFVWPAFAPRALGFACAACLVFALIAMLRLHTQQSLPIGDPVVARSGSIVPLTAQVQVEQPQTTTSSTNQELNNAPISAPTTSRSIATPKRTLPFEHAGLGRIAPREALAENELHAGSENFGVGNAPVVTRTLEGNSPESLSTIPLPVSASSSPLKVTLKDTQGMARVISVDPVSFGAGDLLGGHARVVRTNATDSQGVW